MNGLTNRLVNKFVSKIEKKDVWGPIVVPGIVYNLIKNLVPPEIQKVLVTGIPKKNEEYGACIELGPQAVSRLFYQIVQEIKIIICISNQFQEKQERKQQRMFQVGQKEIDQIKKRVAMILLKDYVMRNME